MVCDERAGGSPVARREGGGDGQGPVRVRLPALHGQAAAAHLGGQLWLRRARREEKRPRQNPYVLEKSIIHR